MRSVANGGPEAAGRDPMTEADVLEIVGRISFDKRFRVGPLGDGFYVQLEYMEPDIRSGEMSQQRGRKWYVSAFATESEVVQTCLTAALASAEHQVREHFGYRPSRMYRGSERIPDSELRPKLIYGPHFSADALWAICGQRGSYDAREDPE